MKRLIELLDPLPRLAKTALSIPVFWAARALTRSVSMENVQVLCLSGGEDEAERVGEALKVVNQYDDRWIRVLQEQVKRIVITEIGVAEFRPVVRGCYLPIALVHVLSPEELALVLVHEATHARLYDRGHKHETEARERIEKVCVRREAAFARKIPDIGDALAERALSRLKTRWWEPSIHAERMRKQRESL